MDKMHQVAVTFGRFNLLHVGHLELFRRMSQQANKVVIGISSAPANLPLKARVEVITKGLYDDDMDVEIVAGHQPFEVFAPQPKNTKLFLGTDQIQLAHAAERAFGWQTELVRRLTSSTTVRQYIDNEDWDLLANIVPGSIIRDVINLHMFKGLRNAEVHAD